MSEGADLNIEMNAFDDCELACLVITDRVKSIGDNAFPKARRVMSFCTSLPDVSTKAFATSSGTIAGYCCCGKETDKYWYTSTGWGNFNEYGTFYTIRTSYDATKGTVGFSNNVYAHHVTPSEVIYFATDESETSFYINSEDGYYPSSVHAVSITSGFPSYLNDFLDASGESFTAFNFGTLSNNLRLTVNFGQSVFYDIPTQERIYGDRNYLYYTKRVGQDEPEVIYDDSAMLTTTADATSPVGEYFINFSPDHEFSQHETHVGYGVLKVNKAQLTAKSGTYVRQYGEDNPDIVFTYSGFKNNESAESLEIKPQLSNVPDKYAEVGTYYVDVAIDGLQNYSVSIESKPVIYVKKANQSITWSLPTTEYLHGDDIPLDATASSGLPIKYASSNTAIIDIVDGMLQLRNVGTAVITASQDGDEHYNAATSVSLTINVNPVLISDITLDVTDLTMTVGSTFLLTATILPENATRPKVTWRSTNEDVAKVDDFGMVTALTKGIADIVVAGADGWSDVAAYCHVTVDESSNVGSISASSDYSLSVVNGCLVIDGMDDGQFVYVIGIDGRTVCYGTERTIPLTAGIYIVKIGTKTYKVSL
jgi:hypothetical protein